MSLLDFNKAQYIIGQCSIISVLVLDALLIEMSIRLCHGSSSTGTTHSLFGRRCGVDTSVEDSMGRTAEDLLVGLGSTDRRPDMLHWYRKFKPGVQCFEGVIFTRRLMATFLSISTDIVRTF